MPRFMITRTLPPLTPEQFEVVRATSTRVCNEVGCTWIRSHITADGRLSFCEYEAEDEEMIRRHAKLAGLAVDEIVRLGKETGPVALR